jgi:hypothetical protein
MESGDERDRKASEKERAGSYLPKKVFFRVVELRFQR